MGLKRFAWACALVTMSAGLESGFAATGLLADGHLDVTALNRAYQGNGADTVRGVLEAFLKSHPKNVTADEKSFTHMYLGILYAPDSAAQAKAEGHFRALLKFSPGLEELPVEVPAGTRDLFARIKVEARKSAAPPDSIPTVPAAPAAPEVPAAPAVTSVVPKDSAAAVVSVQPPAPVAPIIAEPPLAVALEAGRASENPDAAEKFERESDHGWIWWTAGSAAIVGAGVGFYAWLGPSENSGPRRTEVDATLK
jgi:hypothetical protein